MTGRQAIRHLLPRRRPERRLAGAVPLDCVPVRITALAGGVGGAKLLVGIDRAFRRARDEDPAGQRARSLTAIVNTGDDDTIYGVHVSPDVDIVTYWLAGLADYRRGWGLRDDTFHAVEAFGALGVETWFNLGDRDLAVCLYRTERLRAGAALSAVTEAIRRALGVPARILPMSDCLVPTKIETADGRTLRFQEYFVKERQAPEVSGVGLAAARAAEPAPGVLEAIAQADVVVVCPSNPIVSVAPILALRGVRDALEAHPKVVAVSPIVAGAALKGPADRMLRSLGHGASALGVAELYASFCDKFVLDERDEDQVPAVWELGMEAVALDTVMDDLAGSERLARAIFGMAPVP